MNRISTLIFLFILTFCPLINFSLADDIQDKKLFVSITDVIPDIQLDIRYFQDYNFVGEKIDGYKKPKCFLTKKAVKALKKVQDELRTHSMSLLIYDCYRPQMAVDHFVRWAKDLNDIRMKKQFYPELKKNSLFKGYIAKKSGHTRGSTVDLSIIAPPVSKSYNNSEKKSQYQECDCSREKRYNDESLDMGTGFDCFSELSHTINKNFTKEQMKNRLLLKTVMEKHGFKNYRREWWHFSLKGEPFPKRYFKFSVE